MVISSYRPLVPLLREMLPHLVVITSYVLVICWLDLAYHLEDLHFPVTLVAILGTVIGLLLAFRTNSGYARWWEARTLWGAVVNDSRSWVRQLMAFTHSPANDAEGTSAESKNRFVREMGHRHIAWCYALSRSLRRQDPLQDLAEILDESELNDLRSVRNVPNALLRLQALQLDRCYREGHLELYQFVELERTLTRLTSSMGGCERIKNTPFPPSYSRMVNLTIYLFVLFLPFGLVAVPAICLVVTSLALSFAFLSIDIVAIGLQDPFSNRPSDTPMLTLSRTIEIDLRQMLGETDVPAPLDPIAGVYY